MTDIENKLNLEIYSFILNEYSSKNKDVQDNYFYTTSIKSAEDNECGYISDSKPGDNYTKKDITQGSIFDTRRSCDLIDGTISNLNKKPLIPLKDELDDTFKFNLDGITSSDLIKFSWFFKTKIPTSDTIHKTRIKDVDTNVPNMNKLYTIDYLDNVLDNVSTILKEDWEKTDGTFHDEKNETYLKILKPTINEEFVVIGDIHGSFATFVRILLRLRKLNFFDENCIFDKNKHLVFLGDIVDRGTYGFEIVTLIFMLKIKNPKNVHINNGNHEENIINYNYGFWSDLNYIFDNIISSDEITILYNKINNVFLLNHSAFMVQNPNNKKFVYMAHGGYPVSTENTTFKLSNDFTDFGTKDKIFFKNATIEIKLNTIRWNDFYKGMDTIYNGIREGACFLGQNAIKDAYKLNIELTIRAHQDSNYNTKMLDKKKDLIDKTTNKL